MNKKVIVTILLGCDSNCGASRRVDASSGVESQVTTEKVTGELIRSYNSMRILLNTFRTL